MAGMHLEHSPAARSFDVFVIREMANAAASRLGRNGDGYFRADLIAGEYEVGVDVHDGQIHWVAAQQLDGGALHVVARSLYRQLRGD